MMEQTWRWFGPNDRITFEQIKQTGATGVVTALHHIPVGEVWPMREIHERQKLIEAAGLTWSVVESVPVHEDIKRRTGNYKNYIDAYKATLVNLAKLGIKTVCYNFMPVLDWSRTNLKYILPDRSEVTRFEYVKFIAFDIYILRRPNAAASYPSAAVAEAEQYFKTLTGEQIKNLTDTVLLGLPGSLETFSLAELREVLKSYENIDNSTLKSNLFHFLAEIIPVAEEYGVNLAIHPDDPPWPLLGLPRIVGTEQDLRDILNVKDTKVNGLTFCTGSLGAGHFNNVADMAEKFAHRINFVHLRNVVRDEQLNFNECYLFEGKVDMVRVVRAIVKEEHKRKNEGRDDWQMPMRPDHGNQMLDDLGKENYPGYSLYGRMKSLAEIRGLEIGLHSEIRTN